MFNKCLRGLAWPGLPCGFLHEEFNGFRSFGALRWTVRGDLSLIEFNLIFSSFKQQHACDKQKMKWSVKMWNGKCGDMRKILSASWSWQEFSEFLSAYSDTLYDKHKIKTSWADERIEDEGYGMNNEWQTGQIKVPRGQSSREKIG